VNHAAVTLKTSLVFRNAQQRSLCHPSFYFRRLPRKLENYG